MRDLTDILGLRDLMEHVSRAEELLKTHEAAFRSFTNSSRGLRDFTDQGSQAQAALNHAAHELITSHNSSVLRDYMDQGSQIQAMLSKRTAFGFSSGEAIDRMLKGSALGEIDAFVRDYSQTFVELTRAASSFQSAFRPLIGDLHSALSQHSFAGSINGGRWVASAAARLLVDSLPSFPELEAFQRTVERYQEEIRAAEDENTRRKRLGAFLTQAAEGLSRLDLSPEKRVKLAFQLIRILIGFVLWMHTLQQEKTIKGKDAELRRVQREQGQTLTVLAETVRQLKEQITSGRDTGPSLRVSKRSILRDGPSGSSARIFTVRAGARLRLITTVGRWHYVDQLDDKSGGVVRSGWIYRRNVQRLR
jgi:hypothetical protein